ncbi:MAG: putative Ig domain-containing protein [Ekhidna sp.]|nr:putative Ig domain-containing protein [Ekhidna sp.]
MEGIQSDEVTATPQGTLNASPTVRIMIPDQTAMVGIAFSYTFPAGTFSDADGDALTYTATQGDNSPLPTWLTFNAGTRTFSGTPQATDAGTLTVKVTATDGNGGSVSDSFDITVREKAPLGADDAAEVVIFPNPSGHYLEVRSPVGGTFKILSLSGKSLLEGPTNTKVDITSLKSGLYLVQLPDGGLLKFVRE